MSEEKRLLYVNYSLAMGGIERMIVEFCRHFLGQFKIQVAVFESGGGLESDLCEMDVPVISLDKKPGLDVLLVWRLVRLIKSQKIDVVHTNNFNTWLYVSVAVLFCSNVTTVHTEHSLVRGGKKRRYMLEKFLSKLTRYVVAVSDDVKNLMIEKANIASGDISVIQNGVNTNHFVNNGASRKKMRDSLGIGDDVILYGAVGRLVEVKDHMSLVRSFKSLIDTQHQDSPEVRLVIIGGGKLESALKELVAELGLNDLVFMLGERNDVVDWLSAFDVYSMSSLSEGMSISLLEAMSMSLPVVATGVGGNVDLVTQNVNGLLVPAGDVSAFSQAMSKMFASETRDKYGRAGRNYVLAKFSDAAMLEQYRKRYAGEA
jgi:sugar transferase (PEP-CTERM/EpsH1 system associated)